MAKSRANATPGQKGERSRRELLVGAAGALAVLGAETLGRATPAQAGTDGDVVLGADNFEASTTGIFVSGTSSDTGLVVVANDGQALNAQNTNNGGITDFAAVIAEAHGTSPGVTGISGGGAGVHGYGPNNTEGVYAQSGTTFGSNPGATRNGVHGVTNSATDSGVWGENVNGSGSGGPGVKGTSILGEGLYAQSGTKASTSAGTTRSGVHGVTNSTGDAAVYGEHVNSGTGVTGLTSSTGISGPPGVFGGNTSTGPAVKAQSNGGVALYGIAPSNTEGLYAQSGGTAGTTPGATHSGVHGVTNASTAAAVWGENLGGGEGVKGTTGAGSAVHGQATASGGTGVLAENTAGGTALHATGAAKFDSLIQASRSGTVVIPSGQKTATVTPPGGLSASALVLATMQNVAGGVLVKAAVPNPGAGTVQITLNKAPLAPATATVAWFVVN